MSVQKRLFLYSLNITAEQLTALRDLVGKEPNDTTFALIENAADPEEGSDKWLPSFRNVLSSHGFLLEQVDLRKWMTDVDGLKQKLGSKDVIWVGGGNTFYLRWLMKKTQADIIVKTLVDEGKVYAGWSAGAVVAGPTLQDFDLMDDPGAAKEILWEGLGLTELIIVPHKNNQDFAEKAEQTNQLLKEKGYKTFFLEDSECVVVNGDKYKLI